MKYVSKVERPEEVFTPNSLEEFLIRHYDTDFLFVREDGVEKGFILAEDTDPTFFFLEHRSCSSVLKHFSTSGEFAEYLFHTLEVKKSSQLIRVQTQFSHVRL